MIVKSEYFHGHKVSDYGIKMGRVDFATLAKCGEMVLCNDITKLFYSTLKDEYVEPKLVNGSLDYEEDIISLQDKIDELSESLENLKCSVEGTEDSSEFKKKELLISELECEIRRLQDEIDELQEEENNLEIYQYFIISNNLAELLEELTHEIVFYIEPLNLYIWGVTHWGTPWDYSLTEIELYTYDDGQ